MLMLFLVLGLNLVISFLNARNVGRIWAESKAVGGWVRLLAGAAPSSRRPASPLSTPSSSATSP